MAHLEDVVTLQGGGGEGKEGEGGGGEEGP